MKVINRLIEGRGRIENEVGHHRILDVHPSWPATDRTIGPMASDYATTVTRPLLYTDYLTEQLDLLQSDYGVEITYSSSRQEIPFPYVLDSERGAAMLGVTPTQLAQHASPLIRWRKGSEDRPSFRLRFL